MALAQTDTITNGMKYDKIILAKADLIKVLAIVSLVILKIPTSGGII